MKILKPAMVLLLAVLCWTPAAAQDRQFLRIGTGSISGIYFPVGGLIASAISHPPGASLCGEGGSCGVPGLVAVAQASRGSVVNIRNIALGRIESALVQADMAYFAVKGQGVFAGKAVTGLRAIANLYLEAVHVIVRQDSDIRSIRGLKGKRVSLDLKGSGTRTVATLLLKRYGIDPQTLRRRNSQVGPAVDRLRTGGIDAFFFVGGFPAPSIARLAADVPLRLLPVAGAEAAAIREADPFLTAVNIPASAYPGVPETSTLAVGAQWVISDKVSKDLVYGITEALWHPTTRAILDQGPRVTKQMRLENALKGVAIPLHEGASQFYREQGLINAPAPDAKGEKPPAAKPGAPAKAKPDAAGRPDSKS
ncbi:MAG: TAXI family TRAP transporter solute-binding subunit [Alphaproteobacteria bacterium]|nr:TAXI family TRAP transporter solute-binding subunit [Alphaproteobacteria bacterium]